MGSSETASSAVDSSVGSIVWVRRRNGSWWPGKILGTDEISVTHLTSPRSGSPVKLLGKEDASVDWYNLEKSKRVKSFRCGEFEQCISRAEASRGLPPKKREKYAHRQDAINHALELEKQLLEKKYGKLGYSHSDKQNVSPDATGNELVVSSIYLENGGSKHLDSKSNQDAGMNGSFVEMNINGHDFDTNIVKEAYQMSRDDNHSSGLNNLRNLKDFDHLTSVEHVYLPSKAPNGSPAPTSNNTVHGSPGDHSTSIIDVKRNIFFKKQDKQLLVQLPQNSSQISLSEPNMDASTSVSRREQEDVIHCTKRKRYSYVTADSIGSPTDNINYSQMVTPTNRLTPCEESTSDSAEETETDSSDSQTTESDVDDVLSDGGSSIRLEPKYPESIKTYADNGSVSSENHDVTLQHDMSYSYNEKPASASEEASGWQLRRKRNINSTMKMSLDLAERKPFGGSSYKEYFMEKGYTGFSDYDDAKKSSIARKHGCGSRCFDSTKHDLHNRDKLGGNQTASKDCEAAEEFFGPATPAYTFRRQLDGRPLLIDVDLEVKASYQTHGPFISLISKMSGHAIVGHPVQIEFLENGSSDSFLAVIDEFYPEVSNYRPALAPVWRTGRRTANSRVPRTHPHSYPTPDLGGDGGAVNINVGVYHNGKVSFGKPQTGDFGHNGSMMKNKIVNSLLDKRHSRNQPKINGTPCNKKVRTLSSLTSEQNQISNLKREGNMHLGSGLIKPDSVPKAVACIPVKLVFSRLHEELFGQHQ